MGTLRSRRKTAEPEVTTTEEEAAFRWSTSVMLTGPQVAAAAYDFARDLAAIVAEHGHNLQYGADVAGTSVHWYVECGTLTEIHELKTALLDSEDYRTLFDENHENWVQRSFRENLIALFDVKPATE